MSYNAGHYPLNPPLTGLTLRDAGDIDRLSPSAEQRPKEEKPITGRAEASTSESFIARDTARPPHVSPRSTGIILIVDSRKDL